MRSAAARPVTASMRRRPAPIDVSPVMMIDADLARGVDVGAAAELVAEAVVQVDVADADDAHDVGVLVAEEGEGAARERLLVGLVLDVDGEVLAHGLVGQRLDLAQLLRRQRLEMGEVEAQAVRRDQRAGLAHVRAEHLAQGGVQDVGAGVVAHDVAAQALVDARLDGVADGQRAGFEAPEVGNDAAVADGLRVFDDEYVAVPARPISPRSPTWPPPSA